MVSRTLPNLGLKAFFALGEDGWNDEIDSNFQKLSVLVQGGITNIVSTKPLSPAQGDTYLMSSSATSNPNTIAVFDGGQWTHFSPNVGWTIYNRSNDSYVTWVGGAWQSMLLANLRSLGTLGGSTAGVVEQLPNNQFTKRAIGTTNPADLVSLGIGDARYAAVGHTHPVSGVTGFNTRSGNVTLTSGDIIAALAFQPAPTSPLLQGLTTLGSASGLLEQTGPTSFAKRGVGVDSPNNVPTVDQADIRYQGKSSLLSGLANLTATSVGVVEQHLPNTFRIRAIGGVNATDLVTRATADSIYLQQANFNAQNLLDEPLAGKAGFVVAVNEAEDAVELVSATNVFTVIEKTGASNSLAFGDRTGHLRISHTTDTVLNILSDASVDLPIGVSLQIVQTGSGKVIFNPDPLVNLNFIQTKTNKTLGLFGTVTLVKYAANAWTLSGDLAASTGTLINSSSIDLKSDDATITADAA